jgi:hypothetical protein
MLKKYKIVLMAFLLLSFPFKSFALMELDFDFGYDKQLYGAQRQNSVVSRNYSLGLSTYLFQLTALDFNVSSTQETSSQNDRYGIATGLDVVAAQNRVLTNVFGVGLKQVFASRGSRIVPVISCGYARQFVTSGGDISVQDTNSLVISKFDLKESKQRYNSVFGAFILQIKLTEQFSLKGSVKTLFPAFDFDKARDNIKYSVGFAWYF